MILRPRFLLPHTPNALPPCLLPANRGTRQSPNRRQWHSFPFAPSPRRSRAPNLSHRHHDLFPHLPHTLTITATFSNPHHPHCRTFTTTLRLPSQPTESHYDILGVPETADASTLKKRFYTLSRQHHPDLHPTDPTAVQRFQQISESYSTLSDPQKRARYDRDVLRLHHQQRQNSRGAGAGQQGGTYAGSRAPTGLSKRRSAGIFRGPPPSYFAQGGGGAYQPGRNPYSRGPDGEAASSSNSNYSYNGNGNSGAYPGNGDGSGSFTADPQHDFDSSGVFRTQTHEDRKRNARRAAAMAAAQAAAEEDGDFWARFVIISCTLLGGLMIGSLLVGTGGGSGSGSGRKAGGMVRADGSRRDREREGQKG